MSENPKEKSKNKITCTTCFKSIGVPSRMKIYAYLTTVADATVSDIVDQLDLTQPTVSYHLKEMKVSGLLSSRRQGKKVFYFIDNDCPHSSQGCVLVDIDFVERFEDE